MREARFYHRGEAGEVGCELCEHRCVIKPGRRGICGVRENQGGVLYSLVYGLLVSENLDPIEKKPMFHLLPGSRSWSIATLGCNFRCRHCQNHQISQYPREHDGAVFGDRREPGEVVEAAIRRGAASISYTYVEPTIFGEFALDCAVLARERGLKNVFVSNGYMSAEYTRALAPVLDGINIDVKAFTEKFYHEVCGARLQPVLDTVRLMRELGVLVEITTLVIPGWNDGDEELRAIARFIHGIDPAMPWHVTAFYPTFQMTDRDPTPVETLKRARRIGLDAGLAFVYQGNVPGEGGENTFCPACGHVLVRRYGYQVKAVRIENGACPFCAEPIAGIW